LRNADRGVLSRYESTFGGLPVGFASLGCGWILSRRTALEACGGRAGVHDDGRQHTVFGESDEDNPQNSAMKMAMAGR